VRERRTNYLPTLWKGMRAILGGVSLTVPNRHCVPSRFQQRAHRGPWPRAEVAASHGSLINPCGGDVVRFHYTSSCMARTTPSEESTRIYETPCTLLSGMANPGRRPVYRYPRVVERLDNHHGLSVNAGLSTTWQTRSSVSPVNKS
jgi:hypothetical protein